MRDVVVSLLVLTGLIAGVWLFMGYYIPAQHVAPVSAGPTLAPIIVPKKVNAKHAVPRKEFEETQPVAELPPDPITPAAPTPTQVAEATAAPLVPGAVRKIAVGMDTDQVVQLLGKPVLTTLTVERGEVEQSYVYRQAGGFPQVVIHLSDGRVSVPPR